MRERCEECNGELSDCGELNPDGTPSSDCKVCQLRYVISLQEEEIKSNHAKLAKFESLAGVYTQLLMANHALEDRAVLLLGGLIEIERIKGSPPIQVARTIASRCIEACRKQITAHEPEVINEIHPSTGAPEGVQERQAEHIPDRTN